jgi:hypothetical protein
MVLVAAAAAAVVVVIVVVRIQVDQCAYLTAITKSI